MPYSVPTIFAALSIHVVAIRKCNHLGRELADQRARLCMLGLSELQLYWPVGGWISKLFIAVLEKLSRQSSGSKKSNMGGPEGPAIPDAMIGLGSGGSNMRMEAQSLAPQDGFSFPFEANHSFGLYESTNSPMDPTNLMYDAFSEAFLAQFPDFGELPTNELQDI